MMIPSDNAQAVRANAPSPGGTGEARRVPVAPPNATGDGPPPAITGSLSGFLLLFVASRLLYLLLIDPSYLSPQLDDELRVGTMAQELVTGPTLPFTEYRGSNWMLGTSVMGAFTSGFFLLFGPTLFALKLAALLVFTLALAFWYWTIQRAAGERVAGYFALLFCFSPPLLTAYSVAAPGGHGASLLFSALTVFLLFRMLSDERGSPAFPALLGLTAGVGLWFDYILRLKAGRSAPAGVNDSGRGPQATLVGFGILYLVVFTLSVQFSDFKATRYHLPAYPFLFLFVALALARCQEAFPNVQKKIQTVFLAGVVVVGLGTHAPRFSLDRPGAALSAKGYSYALMPNTYSHTHAPAGKDDHNFIPQMVQRPFLSDILPKLSGEDQRDLSRAIALLLSRAAPLNGQAEEFSRIEQLIPPGFDPYFYYSLGGKAMSPHAKELAKAVAEVEFLRHRSPLAHHLALVGIYRSWPEQFAFLDASPEALVNHPGAVDPKLSPHYWRAVGHQAGHYWHNTEHSLSLVNAHLQAFLPKLSPSVQRYVLQGAGTALFHHWEMIPFPPAEIERSPEAYQQGLWEGWGMGMHEYDTMPLFPWQGSESLYWMAWTKGLSARSLVFIQQGHAQLDALFQGPSPSGREPPRHAP